MEEGVFYVVMNKMLFLETVLDPLIPKTFVDIVLNGLIDKLSYPKGSSHFDRT
jgi:hypothetical protein